MICPSCNVEMEPLVAGIFQCPNCRKIVKSKEKTSLQSYNKEIREDKHQNRKDYGNEK